MQFKQKSISSNDVKHHQAGLTLLELIISISLMMLVSVGMVQLADKYSDDVKTAVIADQLKRTGDAARAYIKDNYATIAATATSASPYQITAAMLTAGGYLPTSSVSSNGYGQSVCTLVLQPSANNLQAMVVTEGGTTVDDLTLGDIVKLTGSSSGAILSSAPTVISGAMGGWSIPVATWHNKVNNLGKLCDGTTAGNVQVTIGHPALALWFEDGSYQSNALYRDAVPGQPQLNTMNTPLIMGAGTVQTSGGACVAADLGKLARDVGGKVLMCDGVNWKTQGSAFWQDPVANFTSLPVCNAAAVNQTRVVQTPSVGVGPRAFTCNGATWQPLSMDDSGNLTVAGQLSVGSNNRILGNGAQGTYGATTVAGQKNGWTGVEYRDAAGNYQINQMTNRSNVGYYDATTGRWLSYSDTSGNQTLDQTADWNSGRINPGWAVETWGCTTGQIAKAAYTVADGWAYNGKTLSCQSGVWKAVGGGTGGACHWTGPVAIWNSGVLACPAGFYMNGITEPHYHSDTNYFQAKCCPL